MVQRESILITGGLLVTMDPQRRVLPGSLYLEDGRIREVDSCRQTADRVLDARGMLVLPGFVQTHVHLCQALFRGLADDVDVVDWLKGRIWPLESAHDDDSIHASARLAMAELLAGGTTTALTMESARHTDAVFAAVEAMGLRTVTGSAMMDVVEPGTEMRGLSTAESLEELRRLHRTWHGRDGGRIRVGVMPRGARNCSEALVAEARQFAETNGLLVHTHVSENGPLSRRLKAETGLTDMELLARQGLASERLVIAHGVWLSEADRAICRSRGVKVAHCPSANLKLASGFAPVPELREDGVTVGLGADGAPCNNNMSMLLEMRLASLMHKPRRGPTAMDAGSVLAMATIDGARCLGLEREIGSLEPGKRADVVLLRGGLHSAPAAGVPAASRVVYSLQDADVDTTIVDGRILYAHGRLCGVSEEALLEEAGRQQEQVLLRTPFGPELLRRYPADPCGERKERA